MLRPSKIVCVGRNYVAHAEELGNVVPTEPLIFLKPPSAVIGSGQAIAIPAGVGRVDHEGEIGVVIGRRAKNIPAEHAHTVITGIVPANDVTARDLQRADSQWSRAKGFDTFCPLGEPVTAEGIDLDDIEVVTRVNGEERQRGNSSQMAFSIPAIVEYVSAIMTLEPGDLILTGTPEGISPLSPGDRVEVELVGIGRVENPVVARPDPALTA